MVPSGLKLLPAEGMGSWLTVGNPGNWKKQLGFVLAASAKGDSRVTACTTLELPSVLRALPYCVQPRKVALSMTGPLQHRLASRVHACCQNGLVINPDRQPPLPLAPPNSLRGSGFWPCCPLMLLS